MSLTDETAETLAGMLESLRHMPHLSGTLSQLDQATLAWASVSAEIGEAQHAFGAARGDHLRTCGDDNDPSEDRAWNEAVNAAGQLAAVLRPMGARNITQVRRAQEIWQRGDPEPDSSS